MSKIRNKMGKIDQNNQAIKTLNQLSSVFCW